MKLIYIIFKSLRIKIPNKYKTKKVVLTVKVQICKIKEYVRNFNAVKRKHIVNVIINSRLLNNASQVNSQ